MSSPDFPSEILKLNAIINKAGGQTACTDLLPHEIQQIKNAQMNNHVKIKELTQKNDMLYQKIAFFHQMINIMKAFHNQVQRVFNVMQNGFQNLKKQTAKYEENLLQIYSIDLTDVKT